MFVSIEKNSSAIAVKRRILLSTLAIAVVSVSLYFAITAFSRAWERTEGNLLPTSRYFFLTFLFLLLGQFFLARSWVCLFPRQQNKNLMARTIHMSQIGKYIPGGFSQVAIHVSLGKLAGIKTQKVFIYYVLFHVVAAITGFMFGLPYAFSATGSSMSLRFTTFLAGLSIFLLRKELAQFVLRKIWDITRRKGKPPLINQEEIFRLSSWFFLYLFCHATGFAILLSQVGRTSISFVALFSYGIAFSVGLLALPFPSGAVVRESMLLLLLAWVSKDFVIVAAIFHRAVIIIAEITILIFNLTVGALRQKMHTESQLFATNENSAVSS